MQQAWYLFYARKYSRGGRGNQDIFEQSGPVSIVDGYCNSEACNCVHLENYDNKIPDILSPNEELYSKIATTWIRIRSVLSRGNVSLYSTMYEMGDPFRRSTSRKMGWIHLGFQLGFQQY